MRMDYENGVVAAMYFQVPHGDSVLPYRLPVRTAPIEDWLRKNRRHPSWRNTEWQDQARRIAWRQLALWTKAQVAMIQSGQTELAEVMLPWVCLPRTEMRLIEMMASPGVMQRLLPAPHETAVVENGVRNGQ